MLKLVYTFVQLYSSSYMNPPGFKFSRASYLLSLLRPQIVKDLELQVVCCAL